MSCNCEDPREECPNDEGICIMVDGKCALGDDCACKRGDSNDNF